PPPPRRPPQRRRAPARRTLAPLEIARSHSEPARKKPPGPEPSSRSTPQPRDALYRQVEDLKSPPY
ncbi:MAG: hypothetical protein ACYC8T_36485, partial [Myxococcaceae bacterium]